MSVPRFENGRRVIQNWDRVFEAARAEPRRQLIFSLLDAPPEASVPLPESAINPTVPADPTALRQELIHCHLPQLADRGFIEWERDPLIAMRGPRFTEIGAVLAALESAAPDLPNSLVDGCQRLECERELNRE
ncbi:hypothetical protein G6M89_01515 [Natronolimnobius sp. AArcel1]|uniref:hypothetical protein n=1 Tax=Natronolimnobius sp. AArcel1 TaxID=1679093 RepID=UPI0013EC3C0D|nr:hypothetical protein [Natronolimnobius sp. AArcel1]NGM67698.1 hypothetical protein [Natronolimnobius sp. AArcel1]